MSTTAQEWFSAQDLAGLPELPTTDRGVRIIAERDRWVSRKKPIGKGFEYHFSSLPITAQRELLNRASLASLSAMSAAKAERLKQISAEARERDAEAWAKAEREKSMAEFHERQRIKQEGLAKFAALPDGDKKQRAYSRKHLVELCWEHTRKTGISAEAARTYIADGINTGAIPVPAQFIDYIPQYAGTRTLTPVTLHKWDLDYRKLGLFGLVDKHGHRKNQSVIETTPDLMKTVLRCIIQNPHITAKKIKQYLEAAHRELDIVSEKSIQRFKEGWIERNHQLWTYMTNPDRWKNIYMVAFGSQHERIAELNQLWEMDSTPADWMLQDGRHSVVGVIDLYSRRLKFHVSKTSSAWAVCQTFRRAVLAWGIPAAIRTDNGKDYVSEHFNGVLTSLDIGHELCVPFASEEKGTIERSMRTMSHGILDLLPGFIGHNVAERKQIEARKSFADRIMKSGEVVEVAMTSTDLQTVLDNWADHMYAHDVHGGLNGKTPWQVANAWLQPINRIKDERALDALLAPVDGERTITKEGIRFDNYEYFAPELVEHIGERAMLKQDDDIGRVYVYVDAKYVCVAECPELLGISRKDKAAGIKNAQKKLLTEQAREYRDFNKGLRENIADVVIQHRIEQSANVTEFPKRAEEYSTPALDQAARSISRNNLPQYTGYDDEPAQAEPVNNVVELKTPLEQIIDRDNAREMFEHWLHIDARLGAGDVLTRHEAVWHRSFQTTAEFGTQKRERAMSAGERLTSA